MSRVFWDSMLFIYLLESHPIHADRVLYLLRRTHERGDLLFTSYLAVGEVLAGGTRSFDPGEIRATRSEIDEMGFSYLPFGELAVEPFSQLRSRSRLKIADSINLACAAAGGIDLFLTGDQQLVGLHIAGIQFIADFNSSIL